MGKLVIGVIASHGDSYDDMKEIWVENMKRTANKNIQVYFLYGDSTIQERVKLEKISDNMYNFYVKCDEIFKNILYKTLEFFEWVTRNMTNCIILRTNLSTMYNLNEFHQITEQMLDKQYLFGGTFVHGYRGFDTWFSGATMLFSQEVLKLLLHFKSDMLQASANDDVVLSSFCFKKFSNIILFINLPRIDMTDKPIFQYCSDKEYNNVHCFRFKSSDRTNDIKLMKGFLDSNFHLGVLVHEINKSGKLYLSGDEHFSYKYFNVC